MDPSVLLNRDELLAWQPRLTHLPHQSYLYLLFAQCFKWAELLSVPSHAFPCLLTLDFMLRKPFPEISYTMTTLSAQEKALKSSHPQRSLCLPGQYYWSPPVDSRLGMGQGIWLPLCHPCFPLCDGVAWAWVFSPLLENKGSGFRTYLVSYRLLCILTLS